MPKLLSRNGYMKIIRLLIPPVFLLAVAACAHKPPALGGPNVELLNATALPEPAGAVGPDGRVTYRIGPFDRLIIEVFGVADLKQELQVDGSGDIVLPLAGRIEAEGLTPFELSARIAERLRQRYIRDPQVSVNLKETVSQIVTVEGQVKDPGLYPVIGDMSLIRAIAQAKGTTEFAKLDDVVIFRTVDQKRYLGLYNLEAIRRGNYPDPAIYAGDVVIVGDSPGRRMMRDLLGASSLLATPLVALLQRL